MLFLTDILAEFSGCGDAKTSREMVEAAALGEDYIIPVAAEYTIHLKLGLTLYSSVTSELCSAYRHSV